MIVTSVESGNGGWKLYGGRLGHRYVCYTGVILATRRPQIRLEKTDVKFTAANICRAKNMIEGVLPMRVNRSADTGPQEMTTEN